MPQRRNNSIRRFALKRCARGASFRNSIDALSPQRNHYCHRKAPIFSSVISVGAPSAIGGVCIYTRCSLFLSWKRNPWWWWTRTNIVVSGGMGLIKDAFTALHPWLFRPALSSLHLSLSFPSSLAPASRRSSFIPGCPLLAFLGLAPCVCVRLMCPKARRCWFLVIFDFKHVVT